MDSNNKTIEIYQDEKGKAPYYDWYNSINDQTTKYRISTRTNRILTGNFGDCEPVGNGVSELRLDFGPGYRIYFGETDKTIVILLLGGDKKSQTKDVKLAKQYWANYKEAKKC